MFRARRTFSLRGVAWHDNLEAGRVAEVRLRRLGVIQSAVSNRSAWSTEHNSSTVEQVARPVAVLGSFVHDLIEGWEDVVGKLDLSDAPVPHSGVPNRKSGNALLTQRGVEDTVVAELFSQAVTASEDSTERNILAE